jgi:hypothetical protein
VGKTSPPEKQFTHRGDSQDHGLFEPKSVRPNVQKDRGTGTALLAKELMI